jgi:hypothetical protein
MTIANTATLMVALLLLTNQEGHAYLPNPKLTPGDVVEISRDELCYDVRSLPDVSIAIKRQVFDRYGMSSQSMGYNVDHLIPIALGGSNSIKNLWPQPLAGEWNYQMKNRLEAKLRKLVCAGTLSLEQAQKEISSDWTEAYKKYVAGDRSQGSGVRD